MGLEFTFKQFAFDTYYTR